MGEKRKDDSARAGTKVRAQRNEVFLYENDSSNLKNNSWYSFLCQAKNFFVKKQP